ncbi:hypothetical protein RYX36_001435 [Vicia faba]
MRIQSFILIVFIVIFSSAASNHAAFLNPNDPLVNEIGNFDVNEYNKQGNKLKLKKVLNGVSEIISQGTNYRITLSATDASNRAAFLNPNAPLVNEIGNFVVNEFNKQGNKLKFEKVLNGVSEITSQGTNYRITLSATDGSTSKKYAAIVLDNPTQHVRKLTNFAPIKA